MKGIEDCLLWYLSVLDQGFSKIATFVGYLQFRDTLDCVESSLRRFRVTSSSFFDHGLRHKQIEVVSFIVLPLPRRFSMSCHDELRTAPRRQVAEDRRFDVDARIHGILLLANAGSPLLLIDCGLPSQVT